MTAWTRRKSFRLLPGKAGGTIPTRSTGTRFARLFLSATGIVASPATRTTGSRRTIGIMFVGAVNWSKTPTRFAAGATRKFTASARTGGRHDRRRSGSYGLAEVGFLILARALA